MKALRLWWVVAFYSLRNKLMSLVVSLISLVIHSFNSSSYSSSPWCLALAFLTKHEHAHPVAPLLSWKLLFLHSLCTVSHDIAYLHHLGCCSWYFAGCWVGVFWFLMFYLCKFFFLEFQTGTLSLHYFHCSFSSSNSSCTFLTHSCIHDPFFL